MKNGMGLLPAFMVTLFAYATITASAADEFSHVVPFDIGETEFAPGDHIEITEVRGTMATFSTNQVYSVSGNYKLSSRDEAELALFVTVPNSGSTRIDPKQRLRVKKGAGGFRLIKTMHAKGYPHVSFYPVPSGNSFGGLYFGRGEWLLTNKGWSSSDQQPASSRANQAIHRYLGEPVPPPANLDRAYSREGLERALTEAAQKVGVSIKSIEIDDSEFPFLLGVVSSGDFGRLGDELKTMEGYDFTGSVGYKTHHAFNITPWRVFPPDAGQRIGRRLGVRMQILADKISGQ